MPETNRVADALRPAKTATDAIRILGKLVQESLDRIVELEEIAAHNTGWMSDFVYEGVDASADAARVGLPPAPATPPVERTVEDGQEFIKLPAEWDSMTEEQQGAWLRIAADHGGIVNATDGRTEVEFEGAPEDGGVTATFPPAPPELHERWAQEGEAICAGVEAKSGLTPRAAADAYAKGGPLWLAAWNHEFVMGLPTGMRQAMVADVAEYAPQAAIALGRDILRVSTDGQQEWARQAAGV